jgi:hypothetical protein
MSPPLPLPRVGSAPQGAPQPCVPVATLAVATVWVDGDELEIAAIRLDFDYDGAVIRAGTRAAATPRIRRDGAAEVGARRVLEGLGAIDLSCLDDCDTGGAVDYAVRLDRDVHALCGFSAYALPQLAGLGWRVAVAPDYPWQTVATAVPLAATVESDPERPDWFSLELGIDVDGHRVDLLPALLNILDNTSSLDQLARTPRRCIAVPVGDKRYLPVPPERLRLLLAVLREMYRDAAASSAPDHPRHRPGRAGRGAPRHRPPGALGRRHQRARPRLRSGAGPAHGPRRSPPPAWPRPCAATRRTACAGCSTCGPAPPAASSPTTWAWARRCRPSPTCSSRRRPAASIEPILIVTLTSLVGNWQREFAQVRAGAQGGPAARRPPARAPGRDRQATTSRSRPTRWCGATRRRWPRTASTPWSSTRPTRSRTPTAWPTRRSARSSADNRLALSGTPIENHLGELWALFDLVNPGMLGTAEEFKASFRVPIEQHGEGRRLDALRERVRPVHPAPDQGVGGQGAAAQDRDRPRDRSVGRPARAVRGPAHGGPRRGPRPDPRARHRRLADRDPRRAAQAAPGVLRPAPGRRRGGQEGHRQRQVHHAARADHPAARRRPPDPGVLAVRAHAGAHQRGPARARRRPRHPDRRHRRSAEADRRLRARPRRRVLDQPEGRRRRPEPDLGRHRHPLRSVVEPGGPGPGHRSRLPHRPAEAGVRVQPDRGRLGRGPHAGPAEAQAPARRQHHRRRRRRAAGLSAGDIDDLLAPLG